MREERFYCHKGRHLVEKDGFAPCQLKFSFRQCTKCVAKYKVKYYQRKKIEKERERVYDTMFFDFKNY